MQFSNKKHQPNDLSILVLKDGFSFCTQQQTYAFPFELNTPKASDLQTFIASQGINTSNTRIYHFDTPCVLVPTPFFEEKTKTDYLTAATAIGPTEEVLYDTVQDLAAVVVYPQKRVLNEVLKEAFPTATAVHFTAALLPYLKESAAGDAKRHLYVHLRKGIFDLFLFQGSQLLLHNSFEQKNADDFLYYLFYVTEQFYLKPEQFKLIFLGKFATYASYYSGASDFHPEVEHLTLSGGNKDEASPVPFFQNFFG